MALLSSEIFEIDQSKASFIFRQCNSLRTWVSIIHKSLYIRGTFLSWKDTKKCELCWDEYSFITFFVYAFFLLFRFWFIKQKEVTQKKKQKKNNNSDYRNSKRAMTWQTDRLFTIDNRIFQVNMSVLEARTWLCRTDREINLPPLLDSRKSCHEQPGSTFNLLLANILYIIPEC